MISANNCGAPRWFAVCAAVALAAAPASAQTQPPDTTGTPLDSTADTTAPVEHPVEIVTGDSAQTLFAIPLDREEESDTIPRYTPFCFSAALERRLLHHSQSQRDLLRRAFHHDAGDFFRGERALFAVDYQATPVRHTISPYTLPGPRFAAIFNGQPLNPVEHLAEQDAALDFNDVPTASVGDVYILHGPQAAFLGGASGVAGAWLKKVTPAGEIPESRLEAQKGAYGYAYTKGIITETTASGFSYTAALGYRQAKYNLLRRDDNSYHHFWELEAPLSRKVRTASSLRMYKRDAEFERRPVTVRDIYARRRHDRDFDTRFEYAPDSLRTLSLTLFHRRNESNFEQAFSYRKTLDHLANGAEFAYDRAAHGVALRIAARGARHKFRINSAANWRNTGDLSARALLHNAADSADATRLVFAQAGFDYTGGYDPLPRAAVGIVSQNANKRIALSAGVTPLFPRQYELDLPFEIISTGAGLAALNQDGNPFLRPERQYTGAFEAWFGDTRKSIALVATGGLIANGINWRESVDQTGQRLFRPLNEDFTYASAQLNARLSLTDWLAARGSAALYSVDYDSTANPPYTPDYNLFAALEVQRYFDVVGVDLSGYAEVSFPGSYYGYNGLLYGQQAIVNASATARIKSFAFHFVFEDAFNTQYFAREEYFYIGRYTWYWVTWDFLN